MSVVLTPKYMGKRERSRIILSDHTWVHREHSDFPRRCSLSGLWKDQALYGLCQAYSPSIWAAWRFLLWPWQPLPSGCVTPAFHHDKNVFRWLRNYAFLQIVISAKFISRLQPRFSGGHAYAISWLFFRNKREEEAKDRGTFSKWHKCNLILRLFQRKLELNKKHAFLFLGLSNLFLSA